MPFNKKRRGSNDYRDDETACKRLKKIPSYNPQEICQDLYEIVRNQKTEDGRLLCEPFIRAPKRRNEPDYYVTINTPMDLLKIQHRLKSEEYDDVEEMTTDFQLMINNAKSFYQPDTMEYKNALELWDLFQHSKTQLVSQALGDCIAERKVVMETDEEASNSIAMSEMLQQKRQQTPQSTAPKVPVLKLKVVPGSGEATSVSMENRSEQPLVVEESNSCFSNAMSSGSEGEEETKPSKSVAKRKRRTKKAMIEAMMTNEDSLSHAEDDELLIEQLFSSTVTATEDNRCLTDMFRVLPSKTRFPEYYQVIKDPMDLRLIARKIQSSSYQNVDALIRDIMLVISNAKTFNEPGSQIYKDATSLKKFVFSKKQELEQMRQVRSQRTRGRSLAQQQSNLSAVFAALKSESDEENMPDSHHRGSDGDMSDDDSIETDQWFLYNEVKNHKDSNDQVLCEPFLRLPSKRFYPDYYLEIKRPMSMMKIQKKIKSGAYQDLEGVATDFHLVFNNAKQYNREDSRIYQDADTLQKVMQNKYLELTRSKEVTHELMEQQKGDADAEEGKKRSPNEALSKNLCSLYKFLFDLKVGDRHVIELFMTLPSKKYYPDYYQVISQPIDMNTINQKIRSNKYNSIQSLASDFELMFRNARHYNEETSQVYKDAEMLEKFMHARVQMFIQAEQASRCLSPAGSGGGNVGGSGSPGGFSEKGASKSSSAKLQELFNKVKDYVDNKGRILSTPFMKLPHKNDYPDYYEVITRPMDLLKIQQRLQSNPCCSVDEMFSDLTLVFNNACVYNEPDSQIYKDAVTLLRVCNEGRSELNEESIRQALHVPSVVHRILNTLIQLTISYSDKEGRCYSDTFCELQTNDGAPGHFLTFDEIAHRVELGAYKRLDCLQEDVFKLCEHARNHSSINSQLYEDAVEVQDFFIRKRDELCRQADVLHSPALQFTVDQLYDSVVREKRDKMAVDSLTASSFGSNEEEDREDEIEEEPCMTFEHKGHLYTRGDFVYIHPREQGLPAPILSIDRILMQEDGTTCLRGCWFLRPNETFHSPGRKFIEREVFKSEIHESVSFDKVIGRCLVLHVQQIFDYQPLEIPAKDIYICESRYSSKKKTFRKIKKWHVPMSPNTKLMKRNQSYLPLRSCLVQQPVKVYESPAVVEKKRTFVVLDNMPNGEPGATYYEQLQGPNCWIRIGDCVAVKNTVSSDRKTIVRVDKLWITSSGEAMLSGMLFLHPSEVEVGSGSGSRLYYRKELLLSNREEIRSCSDAIHLCSVLSSRDYCSCRYTQVDEADVYVCDSKFNEADRTFKKFNKPLKHPCLSSSVCEDEILYFKKAVVIIKEPLVTGQSSKVSEVKMIEEESMDFCSSVGDQSLNESVSFIGENLNGSGDLTPNNIKKRKKRTTKVRNITGYIVYAGECRKDIQAEFPDLNFGDISRAVGTRWKNLPREIKEKYEEKARILLADANLKSNESQFSSAVPSPGADSRSMSPNSSIAPAVASKTIAAPTSSLDAAIQQSINQLPQIAPTPQQTPSSLTYQAPITSSQPIMNGAPIFVGVPPQTQKIVHSEAYLRYIHGLARGNKRIGDFDKTFSAKKPDSISMEASKLPSHWLGGGPGHHGDVVSALWAMREHMLRDALNIHNILY